MLPQKLLAGTGGALPRLVNITTTAMSDVSSTASVNMPSGIQAGEGLLLILTAYDHPTFTTPSGWTQITNTAHTTDGGPRTAVYAKVASGAEGSTQNVVMSSATEATAISTRIVDWFGVVSSGVQGSSVALVTNAPNPPSVTASWGITSNLWVAFTGSRGSRALLAYPTNYDLYQTSALNPANGDRAETFMAGRALEAATEDPGVFSFAGTTREVIAGTIVIRGI